jgi:hypothetical protein
MSQPARARPSAIARPMRRPAPVTRATRALGCGIWIGSFSVMLVLRRSKGGAVGRWRFWLQCRDVPAPTRQRRAGRVPRPAAPDCRRDRRTGAAPFPFRASWSWRCTRPSWVTTAAARPSWAARRFHTAPEISALFGATLARAAAAIIAQSAPNIIEFGAGTGKLARDVLATLDQLGVQVDSYTIIELSGELRARQQEALKDFPRCAG